MSRRLLPLFASALLIAAACSSGDDADEGAGARPSTSVSSAPGATASAATEATIVTTTERAVETTIELTTAATAAPTTTPLDDWEQIVPGGDCRCADGSEYSFWVRRADPTKVLFFLQGGGACFNAETCNPAAGSYKSSTGISDDPTGLGGIFDAANASNPLADFSVVYVPYCTGDVHLGNRVTTYAPDRVINHVGAVNAGAALQEMVASFPDATEVLVAGESAGSVPTPLYAGMITDLYPGATVNVLADSSGAYSDVAGVNALLDSIWGVLDGLPDWPEHAALTPETWSFPGLFVQAGRHAPAVTFARHDYAYDEVQAFFASLAGAAPEDLVTVIDANEVQIEAGGIDLLSYIAAGSGHTVLSSDGFYTEAVDGQPLVDWVSGLVANETIADVHCTTCR